MITKLLKAVNKKPTEVIQGGVRSILSVGGLGAFVVAGFSWNYIAGWVITGVACLALEFALSQPTQQ